jgi:UDP-N-acetylglucosamine transferase subunit ALG13
VGQAQSSSEGSPLVFVTVGTDHHPFHRLIGWIDGWLQAGAKEHARALVQSGTSSVPRFAEHHEYLEYPQMEAAVAQAVAVVTHGGPGSVMMCRWVGKKPIVVPRRHDLGEHVDDHQVAFCRRMAEEGEIHLAETEARFRELLDQVVQGEISSAAVANGQVGEAIERFERLVDAMLSGRRLRRAAPR